MPTFPSRRTTTGAVILIAVGVWVLLWSAEQRPSRLVTLATPRGLLSVALAATPEQRAEGLAHRDQPVADGLLLRWDTPGHHPIWMAGMRFPLDLIWLDQDHRVLAILTDVPPCVSSPCELYAPDGTDRATAVLELPAGAAARYGITSGIFLPSADAVRP